MTEARLAKIEAAQERTLAAVEHLTEKVEERTRSSDEWRKKIDRTVNGDGNGHKGHNIRLDRLEQAAARRERRDRLLFASVVALAAKVAYDVFQGLLG